MRDPPGTEATGAGRPHRISSREDGAGSTYIVSYTF
jgi:hypothetical protein